MLFFLLGMREDHSFLDFGCGSLRSGRLILTYLAPDRYFGIEPNRWLIDAAIRHEIGRSMVKLKKPRFAYHADGTMTSFGTTFDFIHAHSVLTHAAPQLARTFFIQAGKVLKSQGLVVATFLKGDEDYTGEEWAYPEVISYRLDTMTGWAAEAGMTLTPIRWPHRNQTYVLAYRREFDPTPILEDARQTYGVHLT